MVVSATVASLISIAGWLGMSVETLATTYAKYREEDLKKVNDAFADMGDFIGRKLTGMQ